MSIFRDRIVLSDGTVIMPDEITRLEVCFINGVDSVEIQTKTRGLYNSQFRTDRPTGMVDSTGKEIFENDRMTRGTSVGTVSFTDDCGWRLVIIKGELSDDEYCSLPLHVYGPLYTITGMVPFGEEP